MRTVSDILDLDGPVAFVQTGTPGNFEYEAVCPWCAVTLTTGIRSDVFGDLYFKLVALEIVHIEACPQKQATVMAVKIAGTEPVD